MPLLLLYIQLSVQSPPLSTLSRFSVFDMSPISYSANIKATLQFFTRPCPSVTRQRWPWAVKFPFEALQGTPPSEAVIRRLSLICRGRSSKEQSPEIKGVNEWFCSSYCRQLLAFCTSHASSYRRRLERHSRNIS
jgi:hypothetical protein